jgi:hypothetical protein
MALLGAGCGDGASSHGEEKATFLREVDKICADSHKRITTGAVSQLRRGIKAGESQHTIEARLVQTTLIPTLKHETEAIRQADAPAGDAAQIDAIVKATEKALREAEVDPESYVQVGGHYRLGSAHYGKAAKLADAYGLKGCPMG